MDKSQPNAARARLQELLAVPESQRTEAEWDELHELEIMLAPGNRQGAPGERPPQNRMPQAGYPGAGAPGAPGAPHRKKPGKKFHRRPIKRPGP